MAAELFLEVVGVLALAAALGILAVAVRQPLIVAFLVVSTIPQPRTNLVLRQGLREAGYVGRFVVSAHWERDVRMLGKEGFPDVFPPFKQAASEAAHPIMEMVGPPKQDTDADPDKTRSRTQP